MAKNIVSNAGDKAKALARIAKLTLDISAEKENAKKVYAEIGKLYFETNSGNPGDFFVQLFDELNLANENLAAMEAELAELKSSLGDPISDPIVDPSGNFEETVGADEPTADSVDEDITVEITEEKPAAEETEDKPEDDKPAE
jgi:hypothetical protein